jgi:hypothetical protein
MNASIVESYKTNRPMREAYFRMNGYTHAEIDDSRDGDGYEIMLTHGNGIGCYEPRQFDSIGAARKWCKEYAPELTVI